MPNPGVGSIGLLSAFAVSRENRSGNRLGNRSGILSVSGPDAELDIRTTGASADITARYTVILHPTCKQCYQSVKITGRQQSSNRILLPSPHRSR
jgi:hypothetical protein